MQPVLEGFTCKAALIGTKTVLKKAKPLFEKLAVAAAERETIKPGFLNLAGATKKIVGAEVAAEFAAAEAAVSAGKVHAAIDFIPKGTGNTIKEFTSKDLIKWMDHAFSDDHVLDGILNLGTDKNDIFAKFINKALEADSLGLLITGDNHIETILNGIQATITVNIKEGGQVRFVNAYIGTTAKKVMNRIEL